MRHKRFTAFAILIFFSLGAWSVVLAAHDPLTSGFSECLQTVHYQEHRPSPVDKRAAETAILLDDDGKLLEGVGHVSTVDKPAEALLHNQRIIVASLTIPTPKVSTNIFLSTLNL